MLTIGAFLDTLTSTEEDRLLTRAMIADWLWEAKTGDGCLIGVAFDCRTDRVVSETVEWSNPMVNHWTSIGLGVHFNQMCLRFGLARVTAAIRARILDNRARRTLQAAPKEELCSATIS